MTMTLGLLAIFAVPLAVEWIRHSRMARITALALALVALSFFQPIPHRAMREVIGLRKAQRVESLPNWGVLSEYASGVITMQHAVEADAGMDGDERLLAIGVLAWLALAPALRSRKRAEPPALREPVA